MHRDKFPEKIPFRLTRMLVNAMEVNGIEGNYRLTCENVMSVLRAHKDSLMAVLEAFVYDPLINWRLVEGATQAKKKTTPKKAGVPSDADASDDGIAELRAELEGMRLKELRRRARAQGVGADELEEAAEADEPKAAMVELLLSKAA